MTSSDIQVIPDLEGDLEELDPLANEAVTDDLEVGISIKNLTKIYGKVTACNLFRIVT